MRPSSSRSEPPASSTPYGGLLGSTARRPVGRRGGRRPVPGAALLRAEAALAAAQAAVGLAPAAAARGDRPGRRLPRLRRRRAGRRGSRVGQPGGAAGGLADPGRRGAGRGRRRAGCTAAPPARTSSTPPLMLVADEAVTAASCACWTAAPRRLVRLATAARVNADGRPHPGPARGPHDVRAHGDRVAHRHRRGRGAAARQPVAARRPARRPGRDRRGLEPAAARAAGGLRGTRPACEPPPPWHTDRSRVVELAAALGQAVDGVREDRHRRGGVVPERDRRAARGCGARARRVLGHAAQAEPRGVGAHPVGRGARPRAGRDGAVRGGARGRAGDRRLARRVVAAARAAAPGRWRRRP